MYNTLLKFVFYFQKSSYKHAFTCNVKGIVEPDQLASEKPADLDLHCFQNGIYLDSARFKWASAQENLSLVGCK